MNEREAIQEVMEAIRQAKKYTAELGTPAENIAKSYLDHYEKIPGKDIMLNAYIDEAAKQQWAFDAVKLISIDLLRDCKPLPAKLSKWLAGVMKDVRRPTHRGRNRDSNFVRNTEITIAIFELVNRGWTPESACNAVASKYNLSLEAAKKIWQQNR